MLQYLDHFRFDPHFVQGSPNVSSPYVYTKAFQYWLSLLVPFLLSKSTRVIWFCPDWKSAWQDGYFERGAGFEEPRAQPPILVILEWVSLAILLLGPPFLPAASPLGWQFRDLKSLRCALAFSVAHLPLDLAHIWGPEANHYLSHCSFPLCCWMRVTVIYITVVVRKA